MAIWEASMKARLAVEFVEQTHAHEVYDHLGDGAKPTGNVNLWEKRGQKPVGYRGNCDMIDGERRKKKVHSRQQSIAKDGGREANRTRSRYCK